MIKILCITNSYPIHPRLRKIGNTFLGFEKTTQVKYFAWDRNNIGESSEEDIVFSTNIGYNNNLLKLKEIRYFEKAYLDFVKIYKPHIVIARFWDMAFLASKHKDKYGYHLIYDINDMPLTDNILKDTIYKYFERKALKKADCILLSSRFYEELYKKYLFKTYIIENYPEKSILKVYNNKKERFTLSFIGGVSYYETAKNLCDAAKEMDMDVKFFGAGKENNKLDEYCQRNKIKNVEFYGIYNYPDIYKFYHMSDLIWAAYPYINKNVQFSISNKFFESLLFEKLGVFSINTKSGEYIEKNNIGFTVDPYSVEKIKELLKDILTNASLLEKRTQNIKKHKKYTWNENIPKLEKIFKSMT